MKLRLLVLVLLSLFVGAAGAPVVLAGDSCQAPDETSGPIGALPKVAAVLKPGGTLHVLAVGSATMFGPDATLQAGTVTAQAVSRSRVATLPPSQLLAAVSTEGAFPRQMANALQAAVPGLTVDVVFQGGRGLSAPEMLALITAELKTGTFQLVLWQTGTVEAVRNTPPGEFAQVLSEGAEAVEAAGANLVLIDPQYSRFLQTNSNLDPYTQALAQAAAMPGVVLFHRFDLMRTWAGEGQLDLERTSKADRRRTVEALHTCLGMHLARMVLAGAKPPAETPP